MGEEGERGKGNTNETTVHFNCFMRKPFFLKMKLNYFNISQFIEITKAILNLIENIFYANYIYLN